MAVPARGFDALDLSPSTGLIKTEYTTVNTLTDLVNAGYDFN